MMRIFSTARIGSGSLAVLIVAAGAVMTTPPTVLAQSAPGASPTFTKDIAPILQRSCQSAIVLARWRRCR